MKLQDFFKDELSIFNFEVKNKKDAIKKISELLKEKGYAKKASKVNKLFLKREKQFSTGIGFGFAIPHLRDEVMNEPVVAFFKLAKPIEWKSLDDKPIEYIFAIAIGKGEGEQHMEILGELSRKFMQPEFNEAIKKVKTIKALKRAL